MSLVVLKLSGNAVTGKDELETIDEAGPAAATGAAAPLAEPRRIAVVYGGGGFGHHYAAKHGVSSEPGSHDARGARAVHGMVKCLNDAISDVLKEHGVAALPVYPPSAGVRETNGSLSLPLAATETIFDESFVPVLHGDVISHVGKGATIVSGNDLMVSLVSGLGADCVDLCSIAPGVPNADGDVTSEITVLANMADALGGSDSIDVTSGMAVRVRKLLAFGVSTHAPGSEGPSVFVAGESPGIVIHGE